MRAGQTTVDVTVKHMAAEEAGALDRMLGEAEERSRVLGLIDALLEDLARVERGCGARDAPSDATRAKIALVQGLRAEIASGSRRAPR